ncbi:MAG: hypothetical protein NW224_05030 [Leptolyngbyaceae cyanobacterium bins.302]|nr:hypothetical protein [Leptolyngbyaceae cyanobacterium bins.302]
MLKDDSGQLIQDLSRGIVHHFGDLEKSTYRSFPCPLHRAVEHLQALCLTQGQTGPIGIPQFLNSWAQQPIKEWGILLELPDDWASETLLEQGSPSAFCIEILPEFSEDEQNQKIFFEAVFERSACQPSRYSDLRCFITEHPVICLGELEVRRITEFEEFSDLLNPQAELSYEPAPESYRYEGKFWCCGHCGGLLHRISGTRGMESLRCENAYCAQYQKPPAQFESDENARVLRLKRYLRHFWHRPGAVELRIEQQLCSLGVEVLLYPERDAYDLHLNFDDGSSWAIDVKFWKKAHNLGQSITEAIPQIETMPHQKSFFVFADELKHEGEAYIRVFLNTCSIKLRPEQVLFESDFIQLVRQQQKKTNA